MRELAMRAMILLAVSPLATETGGVEDRGRLAPKRPGAEVTHVAIPDTPAAPRSTALANGRNNWSSTYAIHSMVYLLQVTGEEKWARAAVDWVDAILAARDAPHPVDGRPFAWFDRSAAVSSPYVWAGFTGHRFAPLMAFAAFVLRHPTLKDRRYRDRSYRDHALSFMREFSRALDVHRAELTTDGPYAYFSFIRPVPIRNQRVMGQPLPVNLNAALFTAMLHLSRAEAAAGRKDAAASLSQPVAGFVAYLNERVLVRRPCGKRTCMLWRYSTSNPRIEDVGHANLVVKFLIDANQHGYRVAHRDLTALANTIEALTESDGTLRANLLDGGQIPGARNSVHFILLLAKYSPELKAKFGRFMSRSKAFAYWGPWLIASR